jgi:hypothetical protein
MRALSTYRQQIADFCYVAGDLWDDLRKQLGRRVAKSKRREIAELRHECAELRTQLDETRARSIAVFAAVQLLQQKIAFEEIRRHEEPGW